VDVAWTRYGSVEDETQVTLERARVVDGVAMSLGSVDLAPGNLEEE
jgi:hypothetical protein